MSNNHSNNRGRGRGGRGGSFRGARGTAARGRGGGAASTTSFNSVGLNYEDIQQEVTPSSASTPTSFITRPARRFAPSFQQASSVSSSSSSKRPYLGGGGNGHTGIGGLSRSQADISSSGSDNAYLRPVAFIKASSSLASTMNKDENDDDDLCRLCGKNTYTPCETTFD